ncbi:hypothetical protein OROMI_019446 [Orobanche minor]
MTTDNIAPGPGHDGIFRRYITAHQRPPRSYAAAQSEAFNNPTAPGKHDPDPEYDEHLIIRQRWASMIQILNMTRSSAAFPRREPLLKPKHLIIRRRWASMIQILNMTSMLLLGDKIQASVPKYLISKFEKLIKEGGFYRFTNFEIEQNKEEFIATRHPYHLKFHKFTSPMPAESLPIPKCGFKLIPFAEFGTEKCYATLLVNVIAEVLNVGDIFELNKNGQCTKRVTIHFLDSM